MKRPVILDCDPGHDDVLAILLAGTSDQLNLLGITTTAGNADITRTTENALRFCALAELDHVPVAQGMGRALLYQRPSQIVTIHGASGLDGYDLPAAKRAPEDRHAVDFVIDTIRQSAEPVTLIATGPLTNVALVLLLAPDLKDNVAEIVLMGGAIGLGNRTPAAEFNVWADPEAAKIVFESELALTMIGLEATHKAQVTQEHAERMRQNKHLVSHGIAGLLEFVIDRNREVYGLEGYPIHDACAVAAALNPSPAVLQSMYVAVETQGETTRGRTVCDMLGRFGRPHNAKVAVDLNGAMVLDMMFSALDRYEETTGH